MTTEYSWTEEFPGSITVCDPEGIILEMNDDAAKGYEDRGGKALIGTNLLDCHPEPSRSQLKEMLETQRANSYTIEKNGRKKFVHQTPWYVQGEYRGFVEIVVTIPDKMPHFIRK